MELELREKVGSGYKNLESLYIGQSYTCGSGEACSDFKKERRQEFSGLKLLYCHIDLEDSMEVFQDLSG